MTKLLYLPLTVIAKVHVPWLPEESLPRAVIVVVPTENAVVPDTGVAPVLSIVVL